MTLLELTYSINACIITLPYVGLQNGTKYTGTSLLHESLGPKPTPFKLSKSCYIASVNFDVCQCKVGLFSNVQSLITLFHGSLCMPNCLICMSIVVTSC